MDKIKKFLLENVDAGDIYNDLVGYTNNTNNQNVSCPFTERHKKGTDKVESFSVDTKKGGCFCHSCGYKASSFIGLYEDLNAVKYKTACKEIYNDYVQELVKDTHYKKPHKDLLNNPFLLNKIFTKRGIDKATIKKFKLGWFDDRLFIPIFNEFDLCVNIRKHDVFKRHDKKTKCISYKKGFGKSRVWPVSNLKHKTIYLCEGELDTLLAMQNGLPAVCITGSGANTWNKDFNVSFKGKTVILLPDNDEAGINGALRRKNAIDTTGGIALMCLLPVKETKEDLTDWFLSYNGTAEALKILVKEQNADVKKSAFKEKENIFADTKSILNDTLTPKEMILLERSNIVFSSMLDKGFFFKGNGNLYYTIPGKKVFSVSITSKRFLSFMSGISPLINTANQSGKFILQHVLTNGFTHSKNVNTGSFTKYYNGSIYVYEKNNKLIQVTNKKMKRVENAINDDSVLLDIPNHEMRFKFNPKIQIKDGIELLWHSFAENVPVKQSDRYLILCWLIGVFFREYVRARPLMRLLARTAYGKSTSSKLISTLLYGTELLSHSASTLAASYEMSKTHPLLIFDNIETRNMSATFEDFMLIAATGGLKAKRQRSTDSGIVIENTNCLLLSNGIEPFNKRELISRTIELNLDLESYGKFPFHEVKILKNLNAIRADILSAIIKLIRADVLPAVEAGYTGKIANNFPEHSKDRFNTYFALMSLILKSLWRYIPDDNFKNSNEMVLAWLDSQDKSTVIQDSETNEVLYYLTTFIDRYDSNADFKIKVIDDKKIVKFSTTTRDLLSDFRILSKHLGLRCTWENERQLGTRIVDAEDILISNGWKRTRKILNGRTVYAYEYERSLKK